MREMKNSGVEWIGEIPSTWRVMPLKALFSFGKGLPITKENLEEAGVPVISYGQIHAKWNSGVTTHDNLLRYVNRSYLESNPQSLVQMGDFIMADTSEDREGCGNCAYIDVEDVLFAGYHTIILRSNYNADNKYLAYLFLTDSWRSQIRKSVSGVKLFSISRRILGSVSVLLPDNTKPIVHYLDSKCSQIDTLIQNVQTQIEKLKTYKQSLITEVVTKGLDPTVPMKDSGVDWIGEIPEDWEVKPLLREIETIVDYRGRTPEKVDEGILLVTARNIKDGRIDYTISREYVKSEEYDEIMHRGHLNIGDLLFTTEAPLGAVANVDRTDFALAQRIIKFSTKASMNPYYLKYWMISSVFQQHLKSYATGSTASGIKASKLCLLQLVRPPKKIQDTIVFVLDGKCSQIDRLIAIKQAKIEKLVQYKRSLIYEYVTGKKEVRL